MAVSDNTELLGLVPMKKKVAELGDLAKVLKSAAAIPRGEDAVENTVVYLTATDGEYLEGHYYQYKMVAGALVWIDIGTQIPTVTFSGSTRKAYYGNGHLFFLWTDATSTDHPWMKSEIVMIDKDDDGNSIGEIVLAASDIHNQYSSSACRIRTDITSEEATTKKKFILRYWWSDYLLKSDVEFGTVHDFSEFRHHSEIPSWLLDEDNEPIVDMPNLVD